MTNFKELNKKLEWGVAEAIPCPHILIVHKYAILSFWNLIIHHEVTTIITNSFQIVGGSEA